MSKKAELQTPVRDRADELKIKYHWKAKDETIQALIDAHENEGKPIEFEIPELGDEVTPMTEAEFKRKYGANAGKKNSRRSVSRLIRCRIQNMNPAKKEWPGEIVSVGSAKLGTFKKYIPFNSPEPYHIPKIIYDMLVDKECTIFYTTKDDRGNSIRKGRLVREYAIEILPDLTAEELSDLARTQALKAGQQ